MRALFAVLLVAGQAAACPDGTTVVELGIDQPVPFRVGVDDDGQRLNVAVETGTITVHGVASPDCVTRVAPSELASGWVGLSIDLARPHVETEVRMTWPDLGGQGQPRLIVTLRTLDLSPPPAADPPRLPVIVLDPGHGGIDSGAVRGDLRESDLMLDFALLLKDVLEASGRFSVHLTREHDEFLRLSNRVSAAIDVEADALISLHADALTEGRARGAAVYTLSEEATDGVAAELVRGHERSDLLAGQDLSGSDDTITRTLIDLAQADTLPRSRALAHRLVAAFESAPGGIHKDAERSANFEVLRAPDVPSVLMELGFMSDSRDLENLTSPEWRERAASAIRDGLIAWITDED